jgi:hypothetical protein
VDPGCRSGGIEQFGKLSAAEQVAVTKRRTKTLKAFQ